MLVLTVGKADSIVAVHAVSLERAGPFTALEDFGVGHSQEEQNQQTPHDGIFLV